MHSSKVAHSGAFGKLPKFGDFVRVRSRGPADDELADWLQRATSVLADTDAVPIQKAGRFLLSFPGDTTSLIGSWCISKDRSQRVFPLTIYTRIPSALIRGGLPSCIRAAALFLEEADALLEISPALDMEGFRTEVSRMVPVRSPAGESLQRWAREQRMFEYSEDSAAVLFGPDAVSRAFSLKTLIRAVTAAKHRSGVMLRCPAVNDVQRNVWLFLVGALLGEQAVLSALWAENCAYIIFGFGAPRRELLAAYTLPDFRSRFLWRVRTTNGSLAQRALESLDPDTRSLLTQPPVSAGAALTALHAVLRSNHHAIHPSKE